MYQKMEISDVYDGLRYDTVVVYNTTLQYTYFPWLGWVSFSGNILVLPTFYLL